VIPDRLPSCLEDPDDYTQAPEVWSCRWTRLTGPSVDGQARSAVVWLCEFPYRTLMAEPPAPGTCAGCPIHEDQLLMAARATALPKAAGF
jgi:hypothetical protein